jgi:hypothetical protein
VCWNALSADQHRTLIEVGVLPFGYQPEGDGCAEMATVALELDGEAAPGPRLYCAGCALDRLRTARLRGAQGSPEGLPAPTGAPEAPNGAQGR